MRLVLALFLLPCLAFGQADSLTQRQVFYEELGDQIVDIMLVDISAEYTRRWADRTPIWESPEPEVFTNSNEKVNRIMNCLRTLPAHNFAAVPPILVVPVLPEGRIRGLGLYPNNSAASSLSSWLELFDRTGVSRRTIQMYLNTRARGVIAISHQLFNSSQSLDCSVLVRASSPGIPYGKGLFFQPADHPTGVDVTALVNAGVNWLAFPARMKGGVGALVPDRYVAIAAEFRAAQPAAQVFAWLGGPEKVSNIQAQVGAIISAAEALDADGIIIDPELEFRCNPCNAAQIAAAQSLIDEARLRATPGNFTIGVTSYASIPLPSGPFSAADYGIPQVYDERLHYSATAVETYVQRWRNTYGFNIVIPMAGVRNKAASPGRSKSPDEMRRINDQLQKNSTDGAIGWWSHHHVTHNPAALAPQRWQVIKEFSLLPFPENR